MRYIIQPTPGGVQIVRECRHEITGEWHYFCCFTFDGSEAGALMFALEAATEASDIARLREATACQHARICAQEGECGSGCTQRLGVPA